MNFFTHLLVSLSLRTEPLIGHGWRTTKQLHSRCPGEESLFITTPVVTPREDHSS